MDMWMSHQKIAGVGVVRGVPVPIVKKRASLNLKMKDLQLHKQGHHLRLPIILQWLQALWQFEGPHTLLSKEENKSETQASNLNSLRVNSTTLGNMCILQGHQSPLAARVRRVTKLIQILDSLLHFHPSLLEQVGLNKNLTNSWWGKLRTQTKGIKMQRVLNKRNAVGLLKGWNSKRVINSCPETGRRRDLVVITLITIILSQWVSLWISRDCQTTEDRVTDQSQVRKDLAQLSTDSVVLSQVNRTILLKKGKTLLKRLVIWTTPRLSPQREEVVKYPSFLSLHFRIIQTL